MVTDAEDSDMPSHKTEIQRTASAPVPVPVHIKPALDPPVPVDASSKLAESLVDTPEQVVELMKVAYMHVKVRLLRRVLVRSKLFHCIILARQGALSLWLYVPIPFENISLHSISPFQLFTEAQA